MKDLIYIPHQDKWNEHFPNPGSNKKDYTLYLSDPQAQYNKLLRTQQKLRNKKKWIPIPQVHPPNRNINKPRAQNTLGISVYTINIPTHKNPLPNKYINPNTKVYT